MNKQVKWGLYLLCVISLVSSVIVGFDRIKVENSQRQYDIVIKYTDVLNIGMQNDMSFEQVLQDLKDNGVNKLLVAENKIISDSAENPASFQAQGKATVYSGYDLMLSIAEEEKESIKGQNNYIWCIDQETEEQISGYLEAKGYRINKVSLSGKTYIEIPFFYKKILATVGVGFNRADLEKAAELGYTICPQITSLNGGEKGALSYVTERLNEIPNLGPIFFNDSDVSCYQADEMRQLIMEHGAGFIEFYSNKQIGFSKLVESSSDHFKHFNMYRLHTLTDGEIDKYEGANLYDRYELALTERGITHFLFKMPKKYGAAENYEKLKNAINGFKEIAAHKGYTEGGVVALNFKQQSYMKTLLAGIGAICIFVLLCMELGQEKLGYVLGIFGFIGYAGLLKLSMKTAITLMALFITITYPTYALYMASKCKENRLIEAVKAVCICVGISLVGAMSFVATMARTEYALGIELFRGVKISFVIPIILIAFIFLYKDKLLSVHVIKKWLSMPITYLVVCIGMVFAGILFVYLLRSGNSGSVSTFQVQLRQALKDIFGTRPRNKEFLIGYPIIMCLIYYGRHKFYIPVSLIAIVGPISVVNTFTHTHTPVLISLQRTLWGAVLGIVLGTILIYVVKLMIRLIKNWSSKNMSAQV